MTNKYSVFGLLLFLPGMAFSASQDAQNFQRMIDLGGGYSVPLSSHGGGGSRSAEANIGVDLPNGLSCNGIDWKSQFKANLQTDLGLNDLQSVGDAVVAASASYLAASIMPTRYEAIQNALKNATKKIQIAKNDCRQIEASLVKNDPLGLYAQKEQAKSIQKDASGGTKWSDAVSNSNATTSWSLASKINESALNPSSKASLNAVLGDVYMRRDKSGKTQTNTQAPDAYRLDRAYRLALKDVSTSIFDRLTSGKDCDKNLFSDEKSQAEFAKNADDIQAAISNTSEGEIPKYDRDKALVTSIKKAISNTQINTISCGSIEAWKVFLPQDRAAIGQILSANVTMRGIGATIKKTKVDLRNLKTSSPDDRELIDQLSPLPQLTVSYKDLKASIQEQNAVSMALVRASQNAQLEKSHQAAERLKKQKHYKPAPRSPSLFGGQ